MVAIRIDLTFSIDATNVRYLFDFATDEVNGDPLYSASTVSVQLQEGAIDFHGDFAALAQAVQSNDPEALFDALLLIRIDAIEAFSAQRDEEIDITGLNLAGEAIATFLADQDAGYAFALRSNDTIVSGSGNDTLSGFAGNDIVLGMNGDDLVAGEGGDDELNGNMGFDTVFGGSGRDFARGGQNDDQVFGDADDDWHVNGNNGADTVHGNDGNDVVHGGQNGDLLFGDLGADTLSGDLDDDTLVGGTGADWFRFGAKSGVDAIKDFLLNNEADRIVVPVDPNGTVLTPAGLIAGAVTVVEGTLINLGGNNVVLIENFARANLREEFFLVI